MASLDQKFYDMVADEIRSKLVVDGIWVRAFAEARGDDAKARAIYIAYRVEQLKAEAALAQTRETYQARAQAKARNDQERERRERHFRTLDAARKLSSFDLYRFGAWIFFGLFCVAWIVVSLSLLFPLQWLGKSSLPEVALVFFATATTLFSQLRQLPAQNVLLAIAIITFVGSMVHLLGANTGMPFGPFFFSDELQPRLAGVTWLSPFIWLLVVFNSRGMARLILRPWRKTQTYGFWVIGLTIALGLALDLGWEVFAARVKNYVFWSETRFSVTWYGVPLVNFLGWILTLLLMLAFITPAMINKSQNKSVPDYNPLLVWLLFSALFLIGATMNQLWFAVILISAVSFLTTIFSVRGARW